MSAHRPVHGHRAVPDERGLACQTCGVPVCEVADVRAVSPHWRHKGVGYHWGDRAEYWRRRALAAERLLGSR